jgi:nucleoid DNA-binding protein
MKKTLVLQVVASKAYSPIPDDNTASNIKAVDSNIYSCLRNGHVVCIDRFSGFKYCEE